MRHRRGRVHPDSALEEPLLATAAVQRRPALLKALVSAWRYLLDRLSALLRLLHLTRQPQPQLSPLQQERLERLRERAAVAYAADDEEHQEALRSLWTAAFPGSEFPAGIKHPQWKEMGWQGEDPGSDFRGGGFMSLQALLWMAQHRQQAFLALMRKEAGTRSTWEYPFAAGGVNLAFMLTEVLELRAPGPAAPTTPAARGFTALLGQSSTAFEELFVLVYRLLDVVWLEQQASYMEFPLVLREVRRRLEACLSRRGPLSMPDLERLLLPAQVPELAASSTLRQ